MKSYMAKPADVDRKWFEVDADGKILGRLAVEVARILMGKHRPTFTPHIDTGDCVVIVNAEKIVITGRKAEQKKYYRYTGYPGGLVETDYTRMQERKPADIVKLAVRRMLPKTKLGRQMYSKLKVYAGPHHSHTAQAPEVLDLPNTSADYSTRKGAK